MIGTAELRHRQKENREHCQHRETKTIHKKVRPASSPIQKIRNNSRKSSTELEGPPLRHS